MATAPTVTEPFPIFKLAHRFLLYDIDTVTYIRREHNICGVLIGSLPQAPQQNVFQGLPLELQPEEARLLVEKKVAYLVDDVARHKRGYLQDGLSAEERAAYQAALRKQGLGAAQEANKRTDDRKKAALKQKMGSENWNDIPDDMFKPRPKREKGKKDKKGSNGEASAESSASASASAEPSAAESNETLFAPPPPDSSSAQHSSSAAADLEPYAVTPTTSYPPLHASAPPPDEQISLPDVPPSYPLFKHLHKEGYFMSPGLRFGCQYVAYPGDPLRFHSHFLVNGMDWDQEFDLIDLVGGGRLGTGVKKGFLIGGLEEKQNAEEGEDDEVRAFCIEWGGM